METALVVFVVMAFLIGTLDFGQYLYSRQGPVQRPGAPRHIAAAFNPAR